jgi:hypothetical protein
MIDVVTALVLVAAPAEPRVRWTTTSACDAAATSTELAALLGPSTPTAAIDVEIREDAHGFTATVAIEVDGARVSRQIDATTCAGLRSAVALIAAVQLDAVATAGAPPVQRAIASPPSVVSPAPDVEPAAAAADRETVPSSRTRPTPAVSPRRRLARLAATIGGGVGLRVLPSASPIIRGGLGLHVRRARVALDVAWLLDRTARLPAPDDDAGAELGLRSATVRGGWAWTRRRLELPILAGIEVGDLTARGIGVSDARVRHGAWVAAVAGVGLAWIPVPAFALVFDPALAIGIGRPTFGVDAPEGVRRLYRPPVVGVRLGAAIEVRL